MNYRRLVDAGLILLLVGLALYITVQVNKIEQARAEVLNQCQLYYSSNFICTPLYTPNQVPEGLNLSELTLRR